MKKLFLFLVIAVIFITAGCSESLTKNVGSERDMVHDVYFALNDNSSESAEKLMNDCYKYLSSHDGIVYFAAGPRVEKSKRDVNVQDWDVSLHIVFKNKEYQDKYQASDDHHKFIDENNENWKSVRVFDSFKYCFQEQRIPGLIPGGR